MRRASTILKDTEQIITVEDLTGVFESIASTQVAKIKNKVQLSKDFFELLWQQYSAIRVDPAARITSSTRAQHNGRKVYVVISAEAGLSGDIDQRVIESMLNNYDKTTTDIVVLGSHGASQLTQRGVHFVRFFKVPEAESYIDVGPVIQAIRAYEDIVVYYEEYVSLGVQEVKTLDLISSLRNMSTGIDGDAITDAETIFEPSLDEIAAQMEATMMTLAFSQTILESSLAQDASRFNAMAVAKKRAGELVQAYQLEFHRAKRSESDRRLREVLVSLKKKKRTQGKV
jgi:F-type H+-transporting ATPase subunit gamma